MFITIKSRQIPLKQNWSAFVFPVFLTALLIATSSCTNDPLKDILPQLKKGIHERGPHNMSFYKSALMDQFVKVTINQSPELKMHFIEGRGKRYLIKIRNVLGEDFLYDVSLPKEFLLGLKNATWEFDRETGEGVFTWKPHETFTHGAPYKMINFILKIGVKQKGSSTDSPLFLSERKIAILVEQSFDTPKLFKVAFAEGPIYEKLDDDNFYSVPETLTPRLERKVFKIKKQNETEKREYIEVSDRELEQASTLKRFPPFFEKKGENYFLLPKKVIARLRQGIHRKQKKEQGLCPGEAVFQNKTDCFVEIPPDKQIELDFDMKIYEKFWSIPETLSLSEVYYKVCPEESQEKSCYVRIPVKKDTKLSIPWNLYAKEKQNYRLIREEELEMNMQFIPKSIKRLLAGYDKKPIKGFNFLLNPDSTEQKNRLDFYIRDENKIGGPHIQWQTDDSFDFHLKFWEMERKTEDEDRFIWKISYLFERKNYNIEGDPKLEQFQDYLLNQFKTYTLSFTPHSAWQMALQSFKLHLKVLPVIQTQYRDDIKMTDYSITEEPITTDEEASRERTPVFSFNSQIAVKYSFPQGAPQLFKSYVPVKMLNKSSSKKLKDYLTVELNPVISTDLKETPLCGSKSPVEVTSEQVKAEISIPTMAMATSEAIRSPEPESEEEENPEQQNLTLQKEFSCSCRLLEPPEEESPHLEALCDFSMVFVLNKNASESEYHHYDYYIDSNKPSLNKEIFENPLSLALSEKQMEREKSLNMSSSEYFSKKTRVHFFHNLKPEIKCQSKGDVKECELIYAIQKGYLAPESRQNLQDNLEIETRCHQTEKPEETFDCPCKTGKPEESKEREKVRFSEKSISTECVFEGENINGVIFSSLKTKAPHVFFLNNGEIEEGEEAEEEFPPHKKTPLQKVSY